MDRDESDKLILDDHISIMIDSFKDERRGFEFQVNPLGVQADCSFSDSDRKLDFSWEAIWDAAGKITDWGYAIEVAIPFNQLRFNKTAGPQTWRFSAKRFQPRKELRCMSSHRQSRGVTCVICQFNELIGFEGITPNLILNAAANPDFSEVEADVAQLEVNQRFALFYPEKRPLFSEGADFFRTPIMAVYTRTVADPLWGTKVTGKVGGTAIGVFAAQDEATNLLFPSNQGTAQGVLEDPTSLGGQPSASCTRAGPAPIITITSGASTVSCSSTRTTR